MGVAYPSSWRRVVAQRAAMVVCVLGVLSYLLLPGLHAVHVGGDAAGHAGLHSHVHHDHAHAHHGEHETGMPEDEGHDADSCGVCRVYFGMRAGFELPVWAFACSLGPLLSDMREVAGQRVVVSRAWPDRPSRGPPAA